MQYPFCKMTTNSIVPVLIFSLLILCPSPVPYTSSLSFATNIESVLALFSDQTQQVMLVPRLPFVSEKDPLILQSQYYTPDGELDGLFEWEHYPVMADHQKSG